MYIKISNLIQSDGNADYKTLNLDFIVPGSQIYPTNENVAYVEYNKTFEVHDELSEVTKEEFYAVRESLNTHQELTFDERLAIQGQRIQEQEQAIMELTALISGGGANV